MEVVNFRLTEQMKQDRKEIWIKTGYELFALKGQTGLQIEPIAKLVGKSKSSFYHHFADLNIFMDELLAYHTRQSDLIAEKENKAKNFNPDIINIFVEHKMDILFSKQMMLENQNEKYKKVLQLSYEGLCNVYIFLIKTDLQININQRGIESFFELAFDNFFLQINADNLNFIWLSNYFNNIKRLAKSFE
jgi:AcrR family transcriptional regulator